MKTESAFPAEITHPDTGERMVLDTSQGSETHLTRLTRDVGIVSGGEQALAKIRDKENAEGRIYVNPVTGYRSRLKPGAAAGAAPSTDDPGGRSSGKPARA